MVTLEVFDAILTRRSIRKYRADRVPAKLVRKILEAATWAPSAHNAQPWRLVVLEDAEAKRKLAVATAEEYELDLKGNGVSAKKREEIVRLSIERFASAPVLITVCLTMRDMDCYPDEERQKAEYKMTVQSVAAAVQNILLAAHAEGLGACWFCAPLFCQDVVRRVLKIPNDVEPQALVTLGYPSEKPSPPPRKRIEEVAYENYWGERL